MFFKRKNKEPRLADQLRETHKNKYPSILAETIKKVQADLKEAAENGFSLVVYDPEKDIKCTIYDLSKWCQEEGLEFYIRPSGEISIWFQ